MVWVGLRKTNMMKHLQPAILRLEGVREQQAMKPGEGSQRRPVEVVIRARKIQAVPSLLHPVRRELRK